MARLGGIGAAYPGAPRPVSYPLLLTVVGWVFFLFLGFGLMSRGNIMSVMALAVGAVAVASAVLLILDLSNPYSGLFRASAAPLKQVLAVMGQGVIAIYCGTMSRS